MAVACCLLLVSLVVFFLRRMVDWWFWLSVVGFLLLEKCTFWSKHFLAVFVRWLFESWWLILVFLASLVSGWFLLDLSTEPKGFGIAEGEG